MRLSRTIACVNSGRSWSSKPSLPWSGRETTAIGEEDNQFDSFVGNFVLEWLSVQSSLRVLFDVVLGIKSQNAIELISMQPILSNLAARKGMKDVEVLALGTMEKSIMDETEGYYQEAIYYLKSMRNHMEAIGSIPRKFLMVCSGMY